MDQREREEELLHRSTPGTLTEETLYKLMDFPTRLVDRSMIHWESLMDDDVVSAFTPYLSAARRLYLFRNKFDPKMINDALRFIHDGIRLSGGSARLIGFGQEAIEEVQRAILQHEANRYRLGRKEKLPRFELSVFPSKARRKLVKIGDGFAPIPNPDYQVVISEILEGTLPPALTPTQIINTRKNIEVVNTLAGTDLALPAGLTA